MSDAFNFDERIARLGAAEQQRAQYEREQRERQLRSVAESREEERLRRLEAAAAMQGHFDLLGRFANWAKRNNVPTDEKIFRTSDFRYPEQGISVLFLECLGIERERKMVRKSDGFLANSWTIKASSTHSGGLVDVHRWPMVERWESEIDGVAFMGDAVVQTRIIRSREEGGSETSRGMVFGNGQTNPGYNRGEVPQISSEDIVQRVAELAFSRNLDPHTF